LVIKKERWCERRGRMVPLSTHDRLRAETTKKDAESVLVERKKRSGEKGLDEKKSPLKKGNWMKKKGVGRGVKVENDQCKKGGIQKRRRRRN